MCSKVPPSSPQHLSSDVESTQFFTPSTDVRIGGEDSAFSINFNSSTSLSAKGINKVLFFNPSAKIISAKIDFGDISSFVAE